MEKGILEGEKKMLNKQLRRRFGDLPSWATEKLVNANEQELEYWAEAVLTVPSLQAVFDNSFTP